ncbi:MAG: vitamin B12-dependent ribonucleotide reductase [Nitrospiraceae bacterium]|nr:vitamin B12-dependent ribonucleotide reductase [Nitrospiraceae bacterium]
MKISSSQGQGDSHSGASGKKPLGFRLAPNALKVLEKRYLKKNEEGAVVETPEELFRRVARAIAAADRQYGRSEEDVRALEEEFYGVMTGLCFLPNSPTLMNAGRRLGQLSACFVLPVIDSMESIFDAVKHAAIIHKSGGGTGFSFSRLRPKGDVVGSTKGVSSGPVSFMTVFDTATEAVKQGGTRRGANMGMLSVHHPDILSFIACKDDTTKLNNFNISIALTDAFMKAVQEDSQYDLVNPRTGKVVQTLSAREVFDRIVEHAWGNGEPGVVFIDRINASNPTPAIGAIESTNPCGEQPLLPYESCNLGSVNLSLMVKDGQVDWDNLARVVRLAVHFLDNVIDVNKYPLPEIEQMTRANRKIGLGVMGWADMLIRLGLPYNSPRSFELAGEVMGFIRRHAMEESNALAGERGAFPNYIGSTREGFTVRNATVTTIAPTGTLSIIAGSSSGIEPVFAICYVRNVMEGTKLIEVNPCFEEIARQRGFWSRDLMERIAEAGSIKGFEEIPEDIKRLFVTAHDITPEEHIRMQAAFQRHVDNAVSKTVNFPKGASRKDVEDVYLLAYSLGCKGVTVYRDGSREGQVLSTGKTEKKAQAGEERNAHAPAEAAAGKNKIAPRKRPEALRGTTRRMHTGCGRIYVTINEDAEGHFFELFTSMGKAGGCAASQSEALGRLISLALRSNIEHEEIIKQLKGISCHQQVWESGGKILSCSDAIAKALEIYHMKEAGGNGNGKKKQVYEEKMLIGACPECGGSVEHEGGCSICRNCGFTKCG